MNLANLHVAFVLSLAVAAAALNTATAEDDALERGANWLLRQQAADGAWRSSTYGQMQNGVGCTAIVLDALSRMPLKWRADNRAAINRATAYLFENLDSQGYVSTSNHSADFPLYATALLMSASDRLDTAGVFARPWPIERQRMRHYLLLVQRTAPERAAEFGGWPQIGGDPADANAESNVNISVSRFVAVALPRDGSVSLSSREAALAFLDRCRNSRDGGYFFIPVADDPLNKAGRDQTGQARSYGTATADAILGLTAWGVPQNDSRVRAAIGWLESQHSLATVPGLDGEDNTIVGAERALKYYYWAALAQVMALHPDSALALRGDDLRQTVVHEQQTDGSWFNSSPLMREDDPLVATALAVTTLAALDDLSANLRACRRTATPPQSDHGRRLLLRSVSRRSR